MGKYYTPSIDEFHVGFEYELNNMMLRGTMAVKPPLEWYKYTFDNERPYDLTFIKYALEKNINIFRVKYLDINDLKNLKFTSTTNDSYYIYNHEKKYILFVHEDHLIEIRKKIENSIEIYVTLFQGIIKNKSELKILLKQLQIE